MALLYHRTILFGFNCDVHARTSIVTTTCLSNRFKNTKFTWIKEVCIRSHKPNNIHKEYIINGFDLGGHGSIVKCTIITAYLAEPQKQNIFRDDHVAYLICYPFDIDQLMVGHPHSIYQFKLLIVALSPVIDEYCITAAPSFITTSLIFPSIHHRRCTSKHFQSSLEKMTI